MVMAERRYSCIRNALQVAHKMFQQLHGQLCENGSFITSTDGRGRSRATLQDALLICYKQSPDNAHSVAFSQRSSSPRLIEEEPFNDGDIINNLIDYEDGQEEPDSLRPNKNMQGSSFPSTGKGCQASLEATQDQMFSLGDGSGDRVSRCNIRILCVLKTQCDTYDPHYLVGCVLQTWKIGYKHWIVLNRLQRAEVDMPLRRFRRQYKQLLQFERGRIIGMMEAGWSVRQVARQLGRSDYVVMKCWGQWIREMSFTRRPGSGRPRQTSRLEDSYIVRNSRVQPTASSIPIQAQVAPSLGTPVSSRIIRRRLAEGHLGSRHPLRVLPLTPPFGVVPRTRKLGCRGMEPGRH
ncbi:transposable element Tcb2 transposase [Trichonephila clavipes]|uniref:Transposable element Tcb2 transposase n=1 Tax=Trichonephila clavipes TaxID=2585209 RepID=A0A8X6SXU0_TRICX|nr:transposable element Tcb2 transposase [Trichonephila clavipes]